MPLITEEEQSDRSYLCRCSTHRYLSSQGWINTNCNNQATYVLPYNTDWINSSLSDQREMLGLQASNNIRPIPRITQTPMRVCEDHYIASCYDCGDEGLSGSRAEEVRNALSIDVCESCADNYSCCENCETMMDSDHTYTTDNCDILCISCYQDYREREDMESPGDYPYVFSYDYRGSLIFRIDVDKDHVTTKPYSTLYSPYNNDNRFNFFKNIFTLDEYINSDFAYRKNDLTLDDLREGKNSVSSHTFLKQSPNLFLGLELEIETNADEEDYNSITEDIYSKWGPGSKDKELLYMKRDGSLSETGVELVFHPMTLSAFKKFVPYSMFDYLRNSGCRSWNTDSCGMHIHLSKNGFEGSAHQYKFVQFINNNSANNYTIAGRRSRWANYPNDNQKKHTLKIIKGESQPYERYMAVNLLPSDTLEVRIFRGSLRYQRIIAALEFVTAVAGYSKNISIQDVKMDTAWDWQPFREFVAANVATYGSLSGYLKIETQLTEIEKEKVN